MFHSSINPEYTIQNKQASQGNQKGHRYRHIKLKAELFSCDDQYSTCDVKETHGNVKNHPKLHISFIPPVPFLYIHAKIEKGNDTKKNISILINAGLLLIFSVSGAPAFILFIFNILIQSLFASYDVRNVKIPHMPSGFL
jgi:hypothetical protein